MLVVEGLCIGVPHAKRIVDDVSFKIDRGESLALLGKSGMGKSLTALSLLRLLDPPIHVVSGKALFEGFDLFQRDEKAMRSIRGKQIGMVFQDPTTALNPVIPVGKQIAESLKLHTTLSRKQRKARVLELMDRTGIRDPAVTYHRYPDQLSGGMKQRVLIAGAIACGPKLLITDEPTTALDHDLREQVMDLLRSIQKQTQMGILLITHDASLVQRYADRSVRIQEDKFDV